MTASLDLRIQACLCGAWLGDHFAQQRQHNPFCRCSTPAEVRALQPAPASLPPHPAHRQHYASLWPLVTLGVRAYLNAAGRVTPEQFASLFKSDPGISAPAFSFDLLHTVQELLTEGMHPRLTGHGAAPCGLIAAAMPAVGIYHAGDPEYAYLDGVELASVATNRTGADWAALCAAAVASAFRPKADGASVQRDVLRIAHRETALGADLDALCAAAADRSDKPDDLIDWWLRDAQQVEPADSANWVAYHPVSKVLPLLPWLHDQPALLLALIVGSDSPGPNDQWFTTGHPASAIIAGALMGALHGTTIFPSDWLTAAAPHASDSAGLAALLADRLATEQRIAEEVAQLEQKQQNGMTALEDRVLGCLLAGAIGNAMGSPVEGRTWQEIDAQYPDSIQTILDPSRLEGEDDNQMAALLADTYIERAGLPVMARHFGATWRMRLRRNHFFALCMGHAYDLICQGWDPRITGHWKIVTGSTVMCMEPVGLYHVADPEFAAIDARAIAYMYQRGLDVTAAVSLAAAVAEALRPVATVDSVIQAAVRALPDAPWASFDARPFDSPRGYVEACLEVASRYRDVLEARAELSERCLLYHFIDPMELWGLSLAMFQIARGDVRQAAIGGTNIGRDSDTIAGRAAMLSGTLHGTAGIPKEWLRLFPDTTLRGIRERAQALCIQIRRPRRWTQYA